MGFEQPIRISPEDEEKIEKEPVSGTLKVRRLAGEFLKKLREKNPDATEEVTFVDDDQEKAA